MAAAEARAAWQRANRCFVQEDAKRAPKLAYCPSSSLMQNDSNIDSRSSQDHAAPSFVPASWNPMNPNLSPDAKWWLQLQPNFGYKKDYICEQLSSLEEEFDEEVKPRIPNTEVALDPFLDESVDVDLGKNENHLEFPCTVFCMNHDCEMKSGIKSATDYSQRPLKHKSDEVYKNEEPLDWKPSDTFTSKRQENASLDLETPWAAVNKSEPWWHITDKDKLASLVARKSLEHIENCDLPKPSQMVHVSMDSFYSVESLETTAILPSPLGQKLHGGSTSDNSQNSYTRRKLDENNLSCAERGYMPHNSEKLYGQAHGYVARKHNQPESNQTSGIDPSRAHLLEALRHSQTRARQAEIAAQKAYDEKEHIVKLLFRQASHLFAYKQWLQILQLESFCLQLKVKDHCISTIIPVIPWVPLKATKSSGKDKGTPPRKKERKTKTCSICKCAFLFAFGLGLAGAGLLLGWTLGWLLPTL